MRRNQKVNQRSDSTANKGKTADDEQRQNGATPPHRRVESTGFQVTGISIWNN